MADNIQLTKNFWLHEMLESQSARRLSFDEQFEPSDNVIENLTILCTNILQPLRDELKIPIAVSSGYRCPRTNISIGGAASSQHLFGQAADIQCFKIGNEALLRKITEMKLPFDQMINEFDYAWVHVSFSPRNRRKILEAYKNSKHETKYREIAL